MLLFDLSETSILFDRGLERLQHYHFTSEEHRGLFKLAR